MAQLHSGFILQGAGQAIEDGVLLAFYGDGSDGNLAAGAGVTTLGKDTYYNNVTLNATDTIATAGYRLFIKGTLTMANGAIIRNNGGVGADGVGGAGGAAGIAAPSGTVLGGSAAGAGGSLAAGAVGTVLADSLGGSGGGGGAGGVNGGGIGGVATVPAATDGGVRNLPNAVELRATGAAAITYINPGCGGGGARRAVPGGPARHAGRAARIDQGDRAGVLRVASPYGGVRGARGRQRGQRGLLYHPGGGRGGTHDLHRHDAYAHRRQSGGVRAGLPTDRRRDVALRLQGRGHHRRHGLHADYHEHCRRRRREPNPQG